MTAPLDDAALSALEQAARAATPGPWETTVVPECDGNLCIKHEHHDIYRHETTTVVKDQRPGLLHAEVRQNAVNVGCLPADSAADAAFIAAAHPGTVLALIAEVRALREALEILACDDDGCEDCLADAKRRMDAAISLARKALESGA